MTPAEIAKAAVDALLGLIDGQIPNEARDVVARFAPEAVRQVTASAPTVRVIDRRPPTP